MTREQRILATAMVLILLLLIGGGLFWVSRSAVDQSNPSAKSQTSAASRPIKVGFILSQATATGPSWVRGRYPLMVRKAFEECLDGAQFEVHPVIEPGTAQSPELQPILGKHFAGRTLIECTDEAQMNTMDVLFSQMVLTPSSDMTTAIEKHVRDQGKGLYIRIGYGSADPGFTPQILAINAMKEATYGWNGADQLCRIITRHSATASTAVGRQLKIEPNGPWGIPDGEALATVDNAVIEPVGAAPADPSSYIFAPFRSGQFGKGRVFSASYLGINNSDGTIHVLRQLNADGVRWASGLIP